MATLSELENALVKAHNAGDKSATSYIVNELKNLDTEFSEPYHMGKEVMKSIGAGVVTPLTSSLAGMASASAEIVDQGRVPFIPQGPAAAYNTFPVPGQTLTEQAGTGEAFDYAQGYLDFTREFPTKVMNISPNFIEKHPFIYGSMQAIGQMPANIATGGTLLVPQLYSEYLLEAEGRLGKPRNEWSTKERGEVDMASMPYLAVGTVLEAIGAGGVVSKPVRAFLNGKTVKGGVLQRGFNSLMAGLQEGTTEYSQSVLLEMSQIFANLDPDEEIDLDTFFGQDKAVAFVSGKVGGTVTRGLLETVEAVTLPKAEDPEVLFDSSWTVRYVDIDGNPVEMEVNGPDKDTVLRRVKEGGGIAEGSPITVTPYSGTTGSTETRDTSETVVEGEVLEDSDTMIDTEEAFVPNDTSEQLTLPAPSQEEAANAMATYVNKKYVGETPEQVPANPGYAGFLQSLGIQKYSEGRFIEISGPNKGRDLTNVTFTGGSVSVIDGKPILITEDRELPNLDLKSRDATKEYGGTLVRTNLFRKGGGKGNWRFIDNPTNIETGTLVSVKQGSKHYFTMDYQMNNPVKLENNPNAENEPRGKPLSRGKLTFGKEVAKINVRGKEHPLYGTITVGDPKPVSELEEAAQTFSKRKSGPVSIERVREQADLSQSYAKDTAAFYDFYITELKSTGNLLKANPSNIKRVAEQMVQDTSSFLANNPHLAAFYEDDTTLTNSYLSEAFNMVPGDEKLYALIDGLMSANTKLAGNSIDSLRAFKSYKENGNFDDIVLGKSAKGNIEYNKTKSKYLLHGTAAPNKARSVKAVGKLLNEMTVEETINYLTTPVTYNELKRFNQYLGYKSNPSKGAIATTVKTATGQDSKFPRVFVFGPKVGSYVMNNLGYLNYTTVDIWESRFIRSYFKGMLDETKDLPETVGERDFFQRVGEQFKIEYEAETGQKITKATAQALRWFYVLDTFAKLGYKGASTNESKSEYTRRGIKEVLGINLESGRPSSEQGAQAAGFESEAAGYISPARRARFEIERNSDRISYRGRPGTDPRRGNRNDKQGGIDLTVSEFVQAAKLNKDTHTYGSSVDVLSEDEYLNHTLILYRSPIGGTVTASISENGELGTITSTEGQVNGYDVQDTIMAAIATGRVQWTQAFDTSLPRLYVPYGFKPVMKLKFDPKQAPKDWSTELYSKHNGGKPDVVFFTFTGEMNRRYSDFKNVPVTDDFITAVDSVQNTDIDGQNFKNGGELMDTVLAEFTDVAKTIGVEIEANLAGPPAIYVAWSPSKRRGKYITFNPYTLLDRSREGVRAAIREELLHGVWHEIAIQLYPNERDIGVPWSKMMTGFGNKLTPEQKGKLQAVYTSLPSLSEASDDLERNNILKSYGAEYTRVAFQHLLFNETPEMFVQGGPAWDAVTDLFKDAQKHLGDKVNLTDVRADLNLAQLVIDSVDVIRSLDIDTPVTNTGAVEGAYAAVPARKQNKPMSGLSKILNGTFVPFMRNLDDMHPTLRQLEVDLNFNINSITNTRTESVKRFYDRYIKDVKDEADQARIAHFISFNPKTKEELDTPYGKYIINTRNELLKKYGLYDDFKEIIQPLMKQVFVEAEQVGVKLGYRYEFFPRYVKDYDGLKKGVDPRNLGIFESIVDEEDVARRKRGEETLTEDEKAAMFTEFLRGAMRTKPLNVKIPSNAKQRLVDIIPQELTQYYEHPAVALVKYIQNMTSTVETMKVYGQYKQTPDGKGVLTGKMGAQAYKLFEQGLLSSYELNERLPEMVKTKLAFRSKAQGVEWLSVQNFRALTYMLTIGKFSTALANLLDIEIAIAETGPLISMKALLTQHKIDLKDFGILAGEAQNEFNFDETKITKALSLNLKLTGFYGADALGKRTVAAAYLIQAQERALAPVTSKKYKALEKDIDIFFPLKGPADKQSLINDLRVNPLESMAVFNYMFSKMSMIQPLSEANYPKYFLDNPQLRPMWALQSFAINRLNYNRVMYLDDIASGDPKRMAKGTKKMFEMAISLMLVGCSYEWLKAFFQGKPFYLPDSILNSLMRLGYGNIYQAKILAEEGIAAYIWSVVTPAGETVKDVSTDLYKVSTGQADWDEARALERNHPFKELWDLLSGKRRDTYRKAWRKAAKEGRYPTFNSDYLGGR